MLERRSHPRRRVCLEALVTGDLHGAPKTCRVRTVSQTGAELVVPDACLPSEDVAINFSREDGQIRMARIVWRKLDRFGVEFCNGSRPNDDARPGPLASVLRRPKLPTV